MSKSKKQKNSILHNDDMFENSMSRNLTRMPHLDLCELCHVIKVIEDQGHLIDPCRPEFCCCCGGEKKNKT